MLHFIKSDEETSSDHPRCRWVWVHFLKLKRENVYFNAFSYSIELRFVLIVCTDHIPPQQCIRESWACTDFTKPCIRITRDYKSRAITPWVHHISNWNTWHLQTESVFLYIVLKVALSERLHSLVSDITKGNSKGSNFLLSNWSRGETRSQTKARNITSKRKDALKPPFTFK